MNGSRKVEVTVCFGRGARGERRLQQGSTVGMPRGRVPRIARLMALAIRFEALLRQGDVKNYAELARRGSVTRQRVTQIMNLLLLAPEIQEALLLLPRVEQGTDPIHLKDLQQVAREASWSRQRRLWQRLREQPQ